MRKTILPLFLTLFLLFSFSTVATASELQVNPNPTIKYSIDFEDDLLVGATLLSETQEIINGRIITTSIYELSDGTIMTDIFERAFINARSKNGSDTATRTRKLDEWGSITLTASFKWRTEGMFSYVKCTSASASRDLDSNAVVSKWLLTRTEDEVSMGKANATLSYNMYNRQAPFQYRDGSVRITCSDSGTISDNA